MADGTRMRIVFAGGAELVVVATADEVERVLSRGSAGLASFEKADDRGGTVYVASAQVAYVEEA